MIAKHIAHYQLREPIGKGGMGEVYRARDTKLDRDVAIKILPEEFSRDKERLARFEREAKVLASLNHPNIASIYGLEVQDGVHALVLELVEGPTLADRIAEGAMPIDEASAIAKQIAEALEAAHERGIVHRDLKPANVKVREDGTVKVLDFGLAKALGGERPASTPELSSSPTLTRDGTAAGLILGTAAYMSPEQAKGIRVDTRTDIWAFGVVLYEMLSTCHLFSGETISDVLAAVLRADIDWSQLPPNTPEPLRRLLRRCLTREPAQRLPHIGAARLEIEDALAPTDDQPFAIRRSHPVNTVLAGSVALLAGVAVFLVLRPSRPPPMPVRASIALPPETQLAFGPNARSTMAISRDGSTLALVTAPIGRTFDFSTDAWPSNRETRIYLRRLDTGELRLLPETEGAIHPFFSPDSSQIGFFAQGELKKMALTGGAPRTLCPVANPWGAVWLDDDRIVFSDPLFGNDGLFVVSAEGGEREVLSVPDESRGEFDHSFPEVSPVTGELIITMWAGGVYPNARVGLLPSDGGAVTHLFEGGSHAHYVPGYLVYARAPRLLAVPFHPVRGRLTGNPHVLLDDLLADPLYQTPQFAVSPSGVLIWASGGLSETGTLSRIDQNFADPKLTPLMEDVGVRRGRIFPGGGLVALDAIGENADIYTYDIETGVVRRLTTGIADDNFGVTDPVDEAIFYWSDDGGHVYRHALNRQDPVPLKTVPRQTRLSSISSDGRYLAYTSVAEGKRDSDIGALDLDRSSETRMVAATDAMEREPMFSPTAPLIAYESDRTKRVEIWLHRLDADANGPPLQVSRDGGAKPFWSHDGKTLFFASGVTLWASAITLTPELSATRPEEVLTLGKELLETRGIGRLEVFGQDADGGFLAIAFPPITSVTQLEAIFHWQPETAR